MKEFELSFKNKRVRIWVICFIPAIILAVVLFAVLSMDEYWIPSLLLVIASILDYAWAKLDKRKNNKARLREQEEM